MKQFLGWWQRADNYDWLSAYLRSLGMTRFTRYLMAIIVATLGVLPALMLLSPQGPVSTLSRTVAVAVSVCCAAMTLMWLRHWPSRTESSVFSIMSTVCVGAACLILPNPSGGLLACAAFASLAGYVAFFRSWRYLVFTLAVAMAVAGICTVRLAIMTDVIYALCNVGITVVAILAIPLSAQVLLHVLGSDARKSYIDPLTGLTNRRGFYRLTRELIAGGAVRVSVLMIDLDHFKRINDSEGHAEGDRALTAVAEILLDVMPPGAVVARAGGEEFLIAHAAPGAAMAAPATQIRERLLTTRWRLSASVGVASTTPRDDDDADPRILIDELIDAADSAMYVAKRSGGNQTRYTAA